MRRCSFPLARLEDHERDLALGPVLVVRVTAVEVDHLGPEALALLGSGYPRLDAELPRAGLNGRLRVRPEVVKPGGMPRRPALRGHDHDVVAVLQVHERRRPLLSALGSDVVEQEHGRQTRDAPPDDPACGAVDERVQPDDLVDGEAHRARGYPLENSAIRFSISSGATSSTRLAMLQRCPKGSSNWPLRSP